MQHHATYNFTQKRPGRGRLAFQQHSFSVGLDTAETIFAEILPRRTLRRGRSAAARRRPRGAGAARGAPRGPTGAPAGTRAAAA